MIFEMSVGGRDPNMNEKDYWLNLEYRLCDEFRGMSDKQFDGMWCDGFIPEAYLIRDTPPQILGKVWIAYKNRQQRQWKFQLILQTKCNTIEEINWDELYPPLNMTKWIAVDWRKELLQFEPAAAVPDEPYNNTNSGEI